MNDWFFQIMTLDQAYALHETLNLSIRFKNGIITVTENEGE